MNYPIHLPGFEGHTIEIQPPGMFLSAKLLFDGQPAPKGKNRGEMVLRRNDGKDVEAKFIGVFMDVPNLVVDGETIQVVEPLKWHQWLWNAIPLLIIVYGGAIPFLVALLAFTANISLFRSSEDAKVKYGLTGLVSVVVISGYILLAMLVALLIK